MQSGGRARVGATLELDLVNELVSGIPGGARREAVSEALEAIGGIYARYGATKPAWLIEALRGQESGTEGQGYDYMHFIYSVIAHESIRLAARRDVRRHPRGITGVAADTGLPLTAFRKFLAGEWLTPTSFKRLVAGLDVKNGGPPHPALVGLSMICTTFPMALRAKIRVALGAGLEGFLENAGVLRPDWLDEEREWP